MGRDWCFTHPDGGPSVTIRKTMFMNTLFAGIFGGWEIVLILAVVLILFGAKKLPELAKGLGQGIKEFKKATNEVSAAAKQACRERSIHSGHPGCPGQQGLISQPA